MEVVQFVFSVETRTVSNVVFNNRVHKVFNVQVFFFCFFFHGLVRWTIWTLGNFLNLSSQFDSLTANHFSASCVKPFYSWLLVHILLTLNTCTNTHLHRGSRECICFGIVFILFLMSICSGNILTACLWCVLQWPTSRSLYRYTHTRELHCNQSCAGRCWKTVWARG